MHRDSDSMDPVPDTEALCCDTALPGAPLGRASAQVQSAADSRVCGCSSEVETEHFMSWACPILNQNAEPQPSEGAAADVPGEGAWADPVPELQLYQDLENLPGARSCSTTISRLTSTRTLRTDGLMGSVRIDRFSGFLVFASLDLWLCRVGRLLIETNSYAATDASACRTRLCFPRRFACRHVGLLWRPTSRPSVQGRDSFCQARLSNRIGPLRALRALCSSDGRSPSDGHCAAAAGLDQST